MTADNRAILAGWLYLPLSVLRQGEAERLRARLVHRSPFAEPDAPALLLHDADGMPGYLGVPREWGAQNYGHLPVEDRTSWGAPIRVSRLPDPNHPRVRDPVAQARFMEDLYQGFQTNYSLVANAPTGSGKTVCALHCAARLGRRTLILVHLERLLDQWQEEIASKLGVPVAQIGRVQQNTCEWDGKAFSVGLLHSVCRRRYPDEFYRAFGTVIFDELHKVGSAFFGSAVHQFPARYRLGLSATLTRQDGGDRVYFYHLGPIRVTSAAEALPLDVRVVPFTTRQALWGSTLGSRVKCLTKDQERNRLIVRIIKRFYEMGRQALVVSDSVLHLQGLMTDAARLGVPSAIMGQYTSETQEMGVGPDGKRRVVKRKQSKAELDRVKAESRLIFATYGMMTEGIDIPRLDAGLDATPRSKATQLIGRIRRPLEGKPKPLWLTIRDTECAFSRRMFLQRCRDYHATGAEIVGHGQEEDRVDRGATGRAEGPLLGAGTQRPETGALCGGQGSPGGAGPDGAAGLPPAAGGRGPIRPVRGLSGKHRGPAAHWGTPRGSPPRR
jgi:superfamily II DNA or RNA helicase